MMTLKYRTSLQDAARYTVEAHHASKTLYNLIRNQSRVVYPVFRLQPGGVWYYVQNILHQYCALLLAVFLLLHATRWHC